MSITNEGLPRIALGRSKQGALVAAIAVVVSIPFAPVGPAAAQDSDLRSLQASVRELDDERRIRDLVIRYGRLLDSRDWAGFARLFATNGEWVGNIGGEFVTIKGPDDIRGSMEDAFASRPFDPDNLTSLHLITNVLIELEGDRATGSSQWTVMSKGSDNRPIAIMTGHYDDIYVRENGEWKILRRVAPRDIPSQTDP